LGRVGRRAEELRVRSPESLWSPNLRELKLGCDLVLCNLECCISQRGRRTDVIAGKAFFFRGPPVAIESLRALGVSAVSLANNHALDYGGQALADTIDLLERAGIASVGAGVGPDAAQRGAILDAAGARVGLLAVSDHPHAYAARPAAWGVALADLRRGLPDWLEMELERLRRDTDAVIIFPHWGPNMTTEPAGWQRKRAAEFLAAGASLVAGHSAHVFHGVERHAGGLAAYDLGGAIDDYAGDEVPERPRTARSLESGWIPRTRTRRSATAVRVHGARRGRGRRLDRN
jgi:poly-gamma-glutamate synthesis protein (capsule biosynthesis protein)